MIAMIATGREAPRAGSTTSAEEFRKATLAIALDGAKLVFLDNQTGKFGSSALCSALTSGVVTDRLLGATRTATAPIRAVWLTTGNNLTFAADMARRSVVCDLDTGDEHPEDRRFKRGNLLEDVREQRGALVCATLTILRAYVVAGRPSHPLPALGGFVAWDSLVHGALIWAGVGDPDAGRARVRLDGDADTEIPKEALQVLAAMFAEGSWTAAEVVRQLREAGLDDDALTLASFAGCKGTLTAQALGDALSKSKNRPLGGLVFRLDGKSGGKTRWRVEVATGAKVASDISENTHETDGSQGEGCGVAAERPPTPPKTPSTLFSAPFEKSDGGVS